MAQGGPHAMYRIAPVVLLTFANDRYAPDGAYLRNLVAERRAIEQVLTADGSLRGYRVVIEQNLTHARLIELIDAHRDAIIGFHYGGHADSVGLHLEDDIGRADRVDADTIAGSLARLPRLRWICLNGCSTRRHLDVLHARLTAPVVATERTVRDVDAQRFAAAFYAALVAGSTLEGAFGRARALGEASRATGGVVESPSGARMLRPVERADDTRWPWVLRAHADAPDAGDWTLAGELAMYGIAGRLSLPQPVRLPRNAVSQLLVARHEVVPFAGRSDELDALDRWADDPEPVRVRLIHGPGGAGKTRLLVEWLKRRATVELAGFLHGAIDGDTTAAIARARSATIVIDYAETRAGLPTVLADLARRWAEARPGRVRVILLARNADDWWDALRLHSPEIDALLHDSPEPLGLPALVESGRRPDEFMRAARVFAAQRRRSGPETPPDLSDGRFGRVLYLHMAALAAVDGLDPSADRLLEGLLDHETRMWLRRADVDLGRAGAVGAFVPAAEAILGAATLRGGLADGPRARDVSRRYAADGEALVGFLRTIYGGGDDGLNPLEPDLLGEALVARLLHGRLWPGWLTTAAAGASVSEMTHGFTVLGRVEMARPELGPGAFRALLASDVERRVEGAFAALLALGELTAHSSLGGLLAEALATHGTPELAHRFDGRVPRRTTMLREAAVWIERAVLDGEGATEERPGEARAGRLVNLAARLSAAGQWSDALSAAEEAVGIYRALAASRPDAVLPDLARGLDTLASARSGSGQRSAAASAVEEAVEIYRSLTARSSAFLPDLARGLNNLAKIETDLGRLEPAASAADGAVHIYRELVIREPEVFLPDLAMALNTLSGGLTGLGRRDGALSALEQAVAIRRALAASRPDAFLPEYARSLSNLATLLSQVERAEDALAASEEAVEAYRALAERQPEAFLPGLAIALDTWGTKLSGLGRWEAAASAAQEAVHAYREMAERQPDAGLPGLVRGLANQGGALASLGRHAAALPALDEAVTLGRRLAARQPDAFLPNLAIGLANLGAALSGLGRWAEALAAAEESVETYRALAASRPEAFAPMLADGLGNLALMLSEAGRREEACRAVEHAVALHRSLVADGADACLPDLARGLTHLGALLFDGGRWVEGLAAG